MSNIEAKIKRFKIFAVGIQKMKNRRDRNRAESIENINFSLFLKILGYEGTANVAALFLANRHPCSFYYHKLKYNREVTQMKKLLKILLFPLFILISVFYKLATTIIGIAAGITGLISLVLIILSVFLFITSDIKTGVLAAVVAWAVSPFGIPLIAQFSLEMLLLMKESLQRKLN